MRIFLNKFQFVSLFFLLFSLTANANNVDTLISNDFVVKEVRKSQTLHYKNKSSNELNSSETLLKFFGKNKEKFETKYL